MTARLHVKTTPDLGKKTEVWIEEEGTGHWIDASNLVRDLNYNASPSDLHNLTLEIHGLAFTLHAPDWTPPPPTPPTPSQAIADVSSALNGLAGVREVAPNLEGDDA